MILVVALALLGLNKTTPAKIKVALVSLALRMANNFQSNRKSK